MGSFLGNGHGCGCESHHGWETTILKGVGHEAVPKATLGSDPNLRQLLLPACLPVMELSLAAHTIINASVPAAWRQ